MKLKKQALRHEIIAKCRAMSMEERGEQSEVIRAKVLDMPEYKQAQNIFCYVSRPDEVDTHGIISHALENGKAVGVPAKGKDGHMVCARIQSMEDIKRMTHGIFLEPPHEFLQPYEIELAIVPGVAFDINNNRMGRGGGFYDRFLAETQEAFRLGICFDVQWLDEVPVHEHDVRMDKVVSVDS